MQSINGGVVVVAQARPEPLICFFRAFFFWGWKVEIQSESVCGLLGFFGLGLFNGGIKWDHVWGPDDRPAPVLPHVSAESLAGRELSRTIRAHVDPRRRRRLHGGGEGGGGGVAQLKRERVLGRNPVLVGRHRLRGREILLVGKHGGFLLDPGLLVAGPVAAEGLERRESPVACLACVSDNSGRLGVAVAIGGGGLRVSSTAAAAVAMVR